MKGKFKFESEVPESCGCGEVIMQRKKQTHERNFKRF
jgi:hypothetical protein